MNTSPVSASHMLEAALPTSLVVARPEQTLILSRRVVHPGFHTSIECNWVQLSLVPPALRMANLGAL